MRWVWIVLVAIVVLVLVGRFVGGAQGPTIEAGSVLVVPVAGAYEERADQGLGRLIQAYAFGAPPSFLSLFSELNKAALDERIGTVVLRIRRLGIGWGKAQEIRDAIGRLRDAGKRTIAVIEVEGYGGNLEYFVATAAEQVLVAPGMPAPLVGLKAEYLFLGGFWQKLGIEVDVLGIGEYKGAVETIGGTEMSDANREMSNSLLDSIQEQFVASVASAREGVEPVDVLSAIDEAPMSGERMRELGLIDGIEHLEALLERLGGPPRVESADYARVTAEDLGIEPAAHFALVIGAGDVVFGSGDTGSMVFASDPLVDALDQAARSDEYDAIILRLDSPGGSGAAAELVAEAVQRASESKPVIASFSDLAASAAYYVAADADTIVSNGGTYTGSIGVFVVRPSAGRLLDDLDIGYETLLRGEHADLLSFTSELSPETRERFRADIQAAYDRFVGRVAAGRDLPVDEIDAVARGRVWTGAQAARRGLVDEVGGLATAIAAAKRRVGVDADATVLLSPLPAPPTLGDQIRNALRARARAPFPEALAPLERVRGWLDRIPVLEPAWISPIEIEIR